MRNPLEWYMHWVLAAPDPYAQMDRALGSAIAVIITVICLALGLHALGVPL